MKSITLIAIAIFLFSCPQDNKTCKGHKEFFSKVKSIDIDKMLGLSISVRGIGNDGNKFIRGVQLNDSLKNRAVLPISLESLSQNRIQDLRPEIKSFASHYRIGEVDTIKYLDSLIEEVIYDFRTLDIQAINSQLHLGEFIEFELSDNCSIYYLVPDGWLNEAFASYFEKGEEVKENWYKIEIKRTKPVLKRHPPNVEIKD
jgi:hypothetical protein